MHSSHPTSEGSPLSPIQKAIWYGQQMLPDQPIYNTAYAFTFSGEIDPSAFSRAHARLVAATDSLRSVVALDRAEPRLFLLQKAPAQLEVIACSPEAGDFVRNRIQYEITRMQDLAKRPWRSLLFVGPDQPPVWFLLHHHILTDGHSFRVLLERQGKLYQEECLGGGNRSGEVESYPQFHDWLARPRAGSPAVSKNRPASERSSFTLSTDTPRASCRGKRMSVTLPDTSRRALSNLRELPELASFSADLTLSQILLTALFALIHRLNESSTITVGVSTHSRVSKRDRETAGIFVEVLPLTLTLDDDESFVSLYDKVQNGLFDQIHGTTEATANSHAELDTDIVFNYLSSDLSHFGAMEVSSEWIYPGCHEPANRCRIHIDNTGRDASPTLLFDLIDAAFPGQAKDTIVSLFLTTLERFADDPELQLRHYTLLTLDNPLAAYSYSPRSHGSPTKNLWNAFADQVAATPHRQAIVSESRAIHYSELLDWAATLSSSTLYRRFSASRTIPILADRSEEMVAASLAAMRIGKAFLPIDPELPERRIATMVEDALAPGAIQSREIRYTVSESGDDRPESPAETAYLIYTSGSTGKPNGVCVGHASVFGLLSDIDTKAPLPPSSRCLWWTSVGFDVSIYEVYSCILYGHTLCVPPQSIRSQPEKLFDWMRENAINSAYLPPFFLSDFLNWLKAGNRVPLLRLLVGVEPIDGDLLGSIARHLPGLKVVNGYGPTETTVCATTFLLPQDPKPGRTPIGFPVGGNRCYVLDKNRNLKPKGSSGELYVGGDGLALGYWQREALQQERFHSDPFSQDQPAARMYKTGDLVRMDESGCLYFLGRADTQIKVRGLRIEPSEIENAVTLHPSVHRAIVRIACLAGQQELVCYYHSSVPIRSQDLTLFATNELPLGLVPKFWIHLKTVPTTRNGKIDYHALPDPHREFDSLDATDFTPPQSEVEKRIHGHFCEILKRDAVPARLSFFDLGGGSLSAMELLNRLNASFGTNLTLKTIFLYPDVISLAKEMEEQLSASIDELSEAQIDSLLESLKGHS